MVSIKSAKSGIIEILVVGNELLNGTTLDTNSYWISKKLDKIGAIISRKTTIRDNLGDISRATREALERKADWIITIGGLGSTFDDMTLQGVAKAIHSQIERNSLALRYLKESYKRRGLKSRRMLRSSLKMAEIPKSAIPLPNSVGSAPGVLVEYQKTRIVSLPGVPAEMKAIFQEHVLPKIVQELEGKNKRRQIWIESVGVRESQIAPSTKKIMEKYPGSIYLKSHPVGFDKKKRSLVNFQLISSDQSEKSLSSLERASNELREVILKLDGRIKKTRVFS